MAALSVIVLTKNEEANLPDLIESVRPLDADLYLVDSGSTDRTIEIAEAAGFRVFSNPWKHYAAQRNWAFDNLPITTPWTLCLDADERLTPEAAREISGLVSSDGDGHDGYTLRKRTMFMGRWLKHGGQYPSYHLRLIRTGRGRCEDRLYDQHFVVQGTTGRLESDYIDILTDSLTNWTERHNLWATLEAEELLGLADDRQQVESRLFGNPIERKRFLRMKVYRKFPLFVRPFLLFLFDYIVRLGFLDGVPGLIFHVLQRFWFRFLIDAKIYERRRAIEANRPGDAR